MKVLHAGRARPTGRISRSFSSCARAVGLFEEIRISRQNGVCLGGVCGGWMAQSRSAAPCPRSTPLHGNIGPTRLVSPEALIITPGSAGLEALANFSLTTPPDEGTKHLQGKHGKVRFTTVLCLVLSNLINSLILVFLLIRFTLYDRAQRRGKKKSARPLRSRDR